MYLNHQRIYDVDKCTKTTCSLLRFDRDVDRDTTFKHSTVLAMPIKHAGSPGRVLGVFQLVNKFDNLPFTRYINCIDIILVKGADKNRTIHFKVWLLIKSQISQQARGLQGPPQFVG